MNLDTIEVMLGGMRMRVPVCKDHETTKLIVDTINAEFQSVSSQGGKFNTQVFAFQTAYQMAGQMVMLQEEIQSIEAAWEERLGKLTAEIERLRQEVEAS